MELRHLVYFLCGFIVLYGMHLLCKKMFPEKAKPSFRALALFLFFVIDYGLYCTLSIPYLFVLFSFLTYLFVTIAYSRGLKRKNFLIAFVLLALGISSELLAAYLVDLFMGSLAEMRPENLLIAALIIARLIFLLGILVMTKLIRYQKAEEVALSVPGLMLLLPALSIGLVLYVFRLAEFDQYSIRGSGSLGAILAVLSIVWINIVSFLLFDRQSHAFQMERETEDLKNTIQIQQEHYNGEMEKREEVRKVRHDYKNFLLALKADLESEHLQEAMHIIDEELKNDMLNGLPQSGFYALDAVVGSKAAIAQKVGIRIVPEYRLECIPNIISTDVCVMIGNALDNAIDYLRDHTECGKQIELDIAYQKGVFNMKTRNRVKEDIDIKDECDIKTTKQEDGHGYGLKSISHIAQKYGGKMILTCKDEMFECGVVLYC